MNFDRPALHEILDRMKARIQETFPDADVSNNSLLGQLIQVAADEADASYQYAEYAARQGWLATAEGDSLDYIGSFFEVERQLSAQSMQMVMHQGTLPSTFEVNGTTYTTVEGRSLIGNYGYLRASFNHQKDEPSTLKDLQGKIQGELIVHQNLSESNVQPLKSTHAGGLNVSWVQGDGIESLGTFTVNGQYCYVIDGILIPGSPAESDESYRSRLKQSAVTFGSLNHLKSVLENRIGPVEIIEATKDNPTTGQPAHSIQITFLKQPTQTNDQIASIIRQARPLGIPTWSNGGIVFQGETWIVGQGTSVKLNISRLDPEPRRAEVIQAIKNKIQSASVGTTFNTYKLAAELVLQLNINVLEFTLDGKTSYRVDSTNLQVI